MISYQGETQGFYDLIKNFGRVSYGFISRSEDLLEKIREEYQKLMIEHGEKINSLIRINNIILKEYNLDKEEGRLNSLTMSYAAEEGELEVLRALRDERLGRVYSWDKWSIICAARAGRLDTLRILRDGSLGGICPWNEWTTANAVDGGHLHVLRALRNGTMGEKCPWDKNICRVIANKYPEILRVIESGEMDSSEDED